MTEEKKSESTEGDAHESSREECGDPWSDFGRPISDFKDLVQELVGGVRDIPDIMASGWPRIDVVQAPGEYLYFMDLPGVDKSDLQLSARASTITVQAKRAAPEIPEGGSRLRSERGAGSFRRTLRVPPDGDTGRVQARLKKGVLRIRVARFDDDESITIDLED